MKDDTELIQDSEDDSEDDDSSIESYPDLLDPLDQKSPEYPGKELCANSSKKSKTNQSKSQNINFFQWKKTLKNKIQNWAFWKNW